MITEQQLTELGFIDMGNGYRGTGTEVVYKKGDIQLWLDWPDTWVVIRSGKERIVISEIDELKKLLNE